MLPRSHSGANKRSGPCPGTPPPTKPSRSSHAKNRAPPTLPLAGIQTHLAPLPAPALRTSSLPVKPPTTPGSAHAGPESRDRPVPASTHSGLGMCVRKQRRSPDTRDNHRPSFLLQSEKGSHRENGLQRGEPRARADTPCRGQPTEVRPPTLHTPLLPSHPPHSTRHGMAFPSAHPRPVQHPFQNLSRTPHERPAWGLSVQAETHVGARRTKTQVQEQDAGMRRGLEGEHPQGSVPRAHKGSPERQAKCAGEHGHKVRKVSITCNCPAWFRSAGAEWAAGWKEGPGLF